MPETPGHWLSILEYAKYCGVDSEVIKSRMRSKKYKPHIRIIDKKIKVDAEAMDRLYDRKAGEAISKSKNPEKATNPTYGKSYKSSSYGPDERTHAAPDSQDDYVNYLEEKRKWSARCEELKYKKFKRDVISALAVSQEAAKIARLARDQLQQIPDRVSGQLINVASYDQVFSILHLEINRVVQELCDGIERIDLCDDVQLESYPAPKVTAPVVPVSEGDLEFGFHDAPDAVDEDEDEENWDEDEDGDDEDDF